MVMSLGDVLLQGDVSRGGSNGNDGNVLGVSHSEMCLDGFQR